MRILMTGSSGFVGKELAAFLQSQGHAIVKLVRHENHLLKDAIYWDPENGKLDGGALEGFDAIIHLAGENIADARWTEEKKRRILDSRVIGTRLLAKAICGLSHPPKVFICASAVGYYGSHGDEILTEESLNGQGFLAEVCRKWEEAAECAKKLNIRVVHARIGVVLSAHGGVLKKMLLPFKLGLGGKIGSGRQYMSWVAIDDLVLAFDFILRTAGLNGPVNITAPNPVTNAVFTKALASTLHRPAFLPVPAFMARLLFGEMADELLLCSTRALPKRLLQAGFVFKYSELDKALAAKVYS